MGLFGFLQSSKTKHDQKNSKQESYKTDIQNVKEQKSHSSYVDSSSVALDERPYYRPDDYYTLYSYPDSLMERRVVPFDERKQISYPSCRGLYVAEIMLLEYCSYGKYPKPSSGYPGFWWFEYGIRDVGHELASLEERGFLTWCSDEKSLSILKVDELKALLNDVGLSTKGKKAELVERLLVNMDNHSIMIPIHARKYELTEMGKAELSDNGYVPYMHRHRHATIETENSEKSFNVWVVNKLFPDGNSINWREVVGKLEEKRFGVNMATSVPMGESKITPSSKKCFEQKEEMRQYLISQKSIIDKGIHSPGDGYEEESKGIDYKIIGKDKEALVQFYISIGKSFNASALYSETKSLLLKYDMCEEAIAVIEAEIQNVNMTKEMKKSLLEEIDILYEQINTNR